MTIIFIIQLVAFFLCLSVHEAAHAWAANRLGDPSAKLEGRMTFNPLAHIDLYGTVIVPLVLAISGAPVFGWAKPVGINPRNFHKPNRDSFLTALAGPISNFLFAILLSIAARSLSESSLIYAVLYLLIQINVTLGVFNLLPIPPLDGSKVWYLILPEESAYTLERYGPLILIAVLIFSSTGSNFLLKFVSAVSDYLIKIIS